ncbi:hypothetical protein K469DRAFT_808050 [Zopfia rhizophila CBS 207.26]|uniref:VWFA domain-containing protein n=1 Tax=Zopfia rhizophila CBS 207.26 TaxID=1314779 RepID=A0A6A6EH22_9PEZI|nr:hypothetical protein K469DRAFT_808050 [Zopfia rhizophila CBS 207.26]
MLESSSSRLNAIQVYRTAKRISGKADDNQFPDAFKTIDGPVRAPVAATLDSIVPRRGPPQTPPVKPDAFTDGLVPGLNIVYALISCKDPVLEQCTPSSSTSPTWSKGHRHSGSDPYRSPSSRSVSWNIESRVSGNHIQESFPEEQSDATLKPRNGKFPVSHRPQWSIAENEPSTSNGWLGKLDGRDHIFLIDDSESMKPYWQTVIRVFKALAYIVKRADPDGIDLCFTSSAKPINRKNRKELVATIEKKKLAGRCDMKWALGTILEGFWSELDKPSERPRAKSRLSLLSPTSSSPQKKKGGISV